MQADGRSLSTYKACLFLWKGEFFMEIQMNIDAECLNLILEHNLMTDCQAKCNAFEK